MKNAVQLAYDKGMKSIALPLIGTGSGGLHQERAKALILDELSKIKLPIAVKIVVFKKAT